MHPAERLVNRMETLLRAPSPLDALRALTLVRAELDRYERHRARQALEGGASYAQIARALGISRQAAHRRFRHLQDELVIAPDARELLRRARDEAVHAGEQEIRAAHVVLAAGRTLPPAPAGRVTLAPALQAALLRAGGTVDADALLRIVTRRCPRPTPRGGG